MLSTQQRPHFDRVTPTDRKWSLPDSPRFVWFEMIGYDRLGLAKCEKISQGRR